MNDDFIIPVIIAIAVSIIAFVAIIFTITIMLR